VKKKKVIKMSRRNSRGSSSQNLVDELYKLIVPKYLTSVMSAEDEKRFRQEEIEAPIDPAVQDYILRRLNEAGVVYPLKFIYLHLTEIVNYLYINRLMHDDNFDNIIARLNADELANSLLDDSPELVVEYLNEHPDVFEDFNEEVFAIVRRHILSHPEYKRFKDFFKNDFKYDRRSTTDTIRQALLNHIDRYLRQ
jgi:hypothetical protein